MPLVTDDEEELQHCEHCGKSSPLSECHMMPEFWICDDCYSDWKKHFDACEHSWEPEDSEFGEPGRYCKKCCGWVADDSALAQGGTE